MPNTAEVVVGVVDGGIGINLSWYKLDGDAHQDFRYRVLRAAGFSMPRLVNLAKNKRSGHDGWKVDWNAWRIPKDECQLQGVDPGIAVDHLRRWFEGPVPTTRFGLFFRLAAQGS